MKTAWYKGIQFRTSSDVGLEQKMPDGTWKIIEPALPQEDHIIEGFKVTLFT